MRKKIIILTILFFFLLPFTAKAQTMDTLASVDVAIWPEFDKPSALVIYQITLPSGTKYPYEMKIRIPAVAGVPNAVAARQADGSLVNLVYEQETTGDWSTISFSATTPVIQFEYYDPSLTKEGKARNFEYKWPGDYGVINFTIEVQQPVGVSELHIIPALEHSQVKEDGLTYYNSDIGTLEYGQTFSIMINYEKDTDALSAEGVPIGSSAPLDTSPGKLNAIASLPWILGILGIVLLAVGAWWYWNAGHAPAMKESQSKKRAKKASTAVDVAAINEGDYIYCPKCGKRASPSDNFCRACGTRLRHP